MKVQLDEPSTRLTDHHRSPLDDLACFREDLYGIAHVTGWEPYDLHHLTHISRVGTFFYLLLFPPFFFFPHTCTLQLLDKAVVTGVVPSPTGSCLQLLSRIGFGKPTARRFHHRVLLS